MVRSSDLRARLAKLLDEARSLEATAEPTPEQETRSGELMAEIEKIEVRIKRVEVLEEAERRQQGQPIIGTGDDRLDEQMRSVSLLRAIAAQIPGSGVDGGREREISAELARRSGRPANGILVPMSIFQRPVEQRVVTTALPGGGPGSNLIATDHMGQMFIDTLRAKMVVRRLGARVLSGLVGNVDVPKLAQSASVGWVAENSALTPIGSGIRQRRADAEALRRHRRAVAQHDHAVEPRRRAAGARRLRRRCSPARSIA